jgi:hypothetical protein
VPSRHQSNGTSQPFNRLVEERSVQSDLGIIADKKQTREEESEWLANLLVGVEKGDILSVAAEADGRIVAISEVTRGRYGDTRHHGYVGISVFEESQESRSRVRDSEVSYESLGEPG